MGFKLIASAIGYTTLPELGHRSTVASAPGAVARGSCFAAAISVATRECRHEGE